MNRLVLPLLILASVAASGCATRQVVVAKMEPLHPATRISAMTATKGSVCFFPDAPDLPHQVIGRVAATKKTYGGTDELAAHAAAEVRNHGGNAVFNWSAAQKFKGPNPFRATAPSGYGVAVLTTTSFDCAALGGSAS